jgi:CMP/dCMP kinase
MPPPPTITIDGPAGAGKSTLGAMLAARLGYLYFDTGVMYRALTRAALDRGVSPHDGEALEALAKRLQIELLPPTADDGRQYTVLADGDDVTWAIRASEVDRNVSLVSSYPGVRAELIEQQRAIGRRGGVVMVGRDIGTVVMPEAPLKIYLRASLDARAERRLADLRAREDGRSLDEVRADVARRDELDSHVMAAAADALVLDSDRLSPAEEVEWIISRFAEDDRR